MANFIPDEIVSEVVASTDLVALVSNYVPLKRSGSSYVACCPFHREKTPSFHVSGDKQLYHCFGCGVGGSALQFVMAAENLDFPDAVRFLADRAGIRIPETTDESNDEFYKKKRKIYELNKDAARYFHSVLFSPAGRGALDYLTNRELSIKTINSFGLGASLDEWDGCLNHLLSLGYDRELIVDSGLCIRNEKNHVYDRFRGRVMFPIIDVRGNVVGFGGRIIGGDGAKYINSPESIVYNKSKQLFALNMAKKSDRDYIILVEGYMDVISLHQAGFNCAVAGCGTALTQEQARLAAMYSKKIYLCYDSEVAGQKAARRAIDIFVPVDCSVRVLSVPDGKDPDEFIKKHGAAEFEKLITGAYATVRYEIDNLFKTYDVDDIPQKVELSRRAAQIIAQLKNAVEQDEYIKYVCRKANISEESLLTEIKKQRRRDSKKSLENEMRQVSSQNSARRTQNGGQTSSRLKKAEAGLLAALLTDKNTFLRLSEGITAEFFTYDFHREIFSAAQEMAESGSSFGVSELSAAFRGREGEFSEVFLSSDSIADPKAAAADFIKIIELEALKKEIDQAVAEGNREKLSELLKKQKSLKG